MRFNVGSAYQVLDVVGEGAYGIVCSAVHKPTGRKARLSSLFQFEIIADQLFLFLCQLFTFTVVFHYNPCALSIPTRPCISFLHSVSHCATAVNSCTALCAVTAITRLAPRRSTIPRDPAPPHTPIIATPDLRYPPVMALPAPSTQHPTPA